MKKLVLSTIIVSFMFVSMILFPMLSSAIAAKPDAEKPESVKEMTTLLKADKALETEFDLNEAKKPRLDQRKSDLEWSAKAVEKEINKWNAANARLQTKIDKWGSDVTAHNIRCDRTVDTQSEYDRCNRSKAALDSRKGTLQGEIQYNDNQRATVQGLIDNQDMQEEVLQREIDAYKAHRKELVEAGVKIQARLAEIRSYLNACDEAIAAYDASPDPMKDGTMERMQAECGSTFDRN
ncbi:MAG: hypothetical protein ISS23_00355 [Nanoarchaeota archaeon]|nr:hypothetical protein [Nanoarchaeota archaeon]